MQTQSQDCAKRCVFAGYWNEGSRSTVSSRVVERSEAIHDNESSISHAVEESRRTKVE
jgi:hypothetical protein